MILFWVGTEAERAGRAAEAKTVRKHKKDAASLEMETELSDPENNVQCVILNLETLRDKVYERQGACTDQLMLERIERLLHDLNWFLLGPGFQDATKNQEHIQQNRKNDPIYVGLFASFIKTRLRNLPIACLDRDYLPDNTCWHGIQEAADLNRATAGQENEDPRKIFYGQKRVNCRFQSTDDKAKEALLTHNGVQILDKIKDKRLYEVANWLRDSEASELPQDAFAVQVDWDATHRKWYSINNRGFTTHNLANRRPLRILPRAISTSERNKRFGPGQNLLQEPASITYLETACGNPEQDDMTQQLNQLDDNGGFDSHVPHGLGDVKGSVKLRNWR